MLVQYCCLAEAPASLWLELMCDSQRSACIFDQYVLKEVGLGICGAKQRPGSSAIVLCYYRLAQGRSELHVCSYLISTVTISF